ncbi:hypothetical protein U14_04150 [Candidatus Moduliflexus flocculans]|uniref:Uncharacterized protein n=1 Tax=Candidatus Moduliflexus flocculans TaxID=1499966 RepID=A0A0S6W003_9BACT|nr:hypothetical protein U14_04150 [Candidatus Moduliflexus flocculans]
MICDVLVFVRTSTHAACDEKRFSVSKEKKVMMMEERNELGYRILSLVQIVCIFFKMTLQSVGNDIGD